MVLGSMYTIKQGPKYMGLTDQGRSYVIGFKSAALARHVQHTLHPDAANPGLQRRNPNLDVTDHVRSKMRQLAVEQHLVVKEEEVRGPIVINPGALLVFAKAPFDLHVWEPSSVGFHMETLPTEAFMCIPSLMHMGIIIPFDIHEEDESRVSIVSDVVEPYFDDPRQFKFRMDM